MVQILAKGDAAAGGLARAATTIGQCALVVLGVHLAADNLDDRVLALLTDGVGLADQHLAPLLARVAALLSQPADAFTLWERLPLGASSAWMALLVEVLAAALLCGSFLLTARQSRPSWPRYRRALSPWALGLPVVLLGVLLAGSWSLAMGVEDVLPAGDLSPWAAGLVGVAALLRFGVPAWLRAVAALEPPKRWSEGLGGLVLLLPVGWLAWVHGVPLWGLLSVQGISALLGTGGA